MIAMALACQPRLLLADEPTTALDATIQAQILDLLDELRRSTRLALMLITHDLGMVASYADAICVVYGGRVMEYGSVADLFDHQLHPYTRGLLRCRPDLRSRRGRLTTIEEVVSDPQEFRPLGNGAEPAIPWWPHMTAPRGFDDVAGGGGYELREIEAAHWVACWRTGHDGDVPSRHPVIAPDDGARLEIYRGFPMAGGGGKADHSHGSCEDVPPATRESGRTGEVHPTEARPMPDPKKPMGPTTPKPGTTSKPAPKTPPKK
jgi:hypothetical protein